MAGPIPWTIHRLRTERIHCHLQAVREVVDFRRVLARAKSLMRKLIFLLFLAVGIGLGWLSAQHDETGLQIGMMAVGALFLGLWTVACRSLVREVLAFGACDLKSKSSRFLAWGVRSGPGGQLRP